MNRTFVTVGLTAVVTALVTGILVKVFLVPMTPPAPGTGSPVRVSGGSIKLESDSGWSCNSGTRTDCVRLTTALPLRPDTPVQLVHVEDRPRAQEVNPISPVYPASILGSWVITITTRDSGATQHGVTVSRQDSTAIAEILNGSGHFKEDGNHWKYETATPGCGNCELMQTISINSGSAEDPWYCNEASGHCYVYIGNEHPHP